MTTEIIIQRFDDALNLITRTAAVLRQHGESFVINDPFDGRLIQVDRHGHGLYVLRNAAGQRYLTGTQDHTAALGAAAPLSIRQQDLILAQLHAAPRFEITETRPGLIWELRLLTDRRNIRVASDGTRWSQPRTAHSVTLGRQLDAAEALTRLNPEAADSPCSG